MIRWPKLILSINQCIRGRFWWSKSIGLMSMLDTLLKTVGLIWSGLCNFIVVYMSMPDALVKTVWADLIWIVQFHSCMHVVINWHRSSWLTDQFDYSRNIRQGIHSRILVQLFGSEHGFKYQPILIYINNILADFEALCSILTL